MKTKTFGSLSFKIDRPKGTVKEWPQADGTIKRWEYPVDYGYLPRHTGEDAEGLDFFVGDDPEGHLESFQKLKRNDDGQRALDETKFLVGVTDADRETIYRLYGNEVWHRKVYRSLDELKADLGKFQPKRKGRYISKVAAHSHKWTYGYLPGLGFRHCACGDVDEVDPDGSTRPAPRETQAMIRRKYAPASGGEKKAHMSRELYDVLMEKDAINFGGVGAALRGAVDRFRGSAPTHLPLQNARPWAPAVIPHSQGTAPTVPARPAARPPQAAPAPQAPVSGVRPASRAQATAAPRGQYANLHAELFDHWLQNPGASMTASMAERAGQLGYHDLAGAQDMKEMMRGLERHGVSRQDQFSSAMSNNNDLSKLVAPPGRRPPPLPKYSSHITRIKRATLARYGFKEADAKFADIDKRIMGEIEMTGPNPMDWAFSRMTGPQLTAGAETSSTPGARDP